MRKPMLAGTALLALAVAVPSARAAYTVTLTQEGSDVVAEGSGTINTTDLEPLFVGIAASNINPQSAAINTGPGFATTEFYTGLQAGPISFGSGEQTTPNSGNGDEVGLQAGNGFNLVIVPEGYVSSSSLTDSSTYADQTFGSLGATPGTYIYNFGSGANADTFTVQIGVPASIPEPASLALFGTGLAGFALIRRWRHG